MIEKRSSEVEALFVEEMAVWIEDLEKAGRVKREMSSSAFRWSSVEAVEEMQRRSYLKWWREAGSGEEGEGKEGTRLALLAMLMVSCLWSDRVRSSWRCGSGPEMGSLSDCALGGAEGRER